MNFLKFANFVQKSAILLKKKFILIKNRYFIENLVFEEKKILILL